jgi:DNA-binding transcriptional regulator GbsR (MarR family)|tara:strand:+ start:276 stop:656 length:381 start_codon:yes stop_codon:yes gene_type:complete
MIDSFEEWTDHTKAPKWAQPVGQLIWEARPRSILSDEIEEQLKISDSTVRIAVHYLRATMFMPIGSEGGGKKKAKGYFWATYGEELDTTIHHGEQRARSIQSWVDALYVVQQELPSKNQFTLEFSP